MPITKHNYLVTQPRRHPARGSPRPSTSPPSGRPGAVLVDIAKDALQAQTRFQLAHHDGTARLSAHDETAPKQIREAARMMPDARKPVLYVGGGMIPASASRELLTLAELTGLPVRHDADGPRRRFRTATRSTSACPGMHGTVTAVGAAARRSAGRLGTRFDDRVTGKLASFAPKAKVIHADIDPAEIGKNRRADVPIVGDIKAGHHRPDRRAARPARGRRSDVGDWWRALHGVHHLPAGLRPPDDGTLSPEYVIEALGQIAGSDAVYVAGVGQHQMWAAQFRAVRAPAHVAQLRRARHDGLRGPGGDGRQACRPDAEVWAIDGDGCFQMTNQELATCAIEGAPIKVAIINNGNLGMVRQWQSLFYDERYSQTNMATHSHRIPDFVKLAEALGCVGLRCEREEDVVDVINQARTINDRPVVIDFIVGADAQVWPMVAAGTGNDEIQAAPGDPAAVRHGGPRLMTVSTHTLSVLVEDKPGVLARVASLFSRRGFNIQSLAVGATEQKNLSRMTIVVTVEDLPLEQVSKQLHKLVNVIKVVEQENENSVDRELALIKVRADAGTRGQVIEAVNLFRAKVIDVSTESLIIESTGTQEKIEALLRVLEPYGVREIVQSGVVSMSRGPRSITQR